MGIGKARPLAGADIDWSRWYRPVCVGLTALAAVWGAVVVAVILLDRARFGPPGLDLGTYMDATHRWFATGEFYDPRQLGGPYPIWPHAILYPPIALYLFAPFAGVGSLKPLWWAIPLAAIIWAIWRHHPRPWAWPLIVAGICWPSTLVLIYTGNPGIWVAAGVALGTFYGWPALAVAMKPTLAPFVLVGANQRSWRIGAVVVALLALPFGSLWLDWWQAVTNVYGWRVGLLYSLGDVPLMAAPVLAWLARTR